VIVEDVLSAKMEIGSISMGDYLPTSNVPRCITIRFPDGALDPLECA